MFFVASQVSGGFAVSGAAPFPDGPRHCPQLSSGLDSGVVVSGSDPDTVAVETT
jgi:hypothetical protein